MLCSIGVGVRTGVQKRAVLPSSAVSDAVQSPPAPPLAVPSLRVGVDGEDAVAAGAADVLSAPASHKKVSWRCDSGGERGWAEGGDF